jgi:hypothetical protein
MQAMVYGLGSGGRIFTWLTALPLPRSTALSNALRRLSKSAISPAIRSCGARCGISRTTSVTSTTVSPFNTPNRKVVKEQQLHSNLSAQNFVPVHRTPFRAAPSAGSSTTCRIGPC